MVLQSVGTGIVGIATISNSVLADDTDPRIDPLAGNLPSDNVRVTRVDPLPCGVAPNQNHVAPTGNWIRHSVLLGTRDCSATREALNNNKTIFEIDGERIVYDEASDWKQRNHPDEGYECIFAFEYETPPKRPQTYEFSFNLQNFPSLTSSAEIEVVPRNKAISDCTGEELS